MPAAAAQHSSLCSGTVPVTLCVSRAGQERRHKKSKKEKKEHKHKHKNKHKKVMT